MILVGTKKVSILWGTKRGSTTINRILEDCKDITKFNFTDDYDGIILIPCRKFSSSLETAYCEFIKKELKDGDTKYKDFISQLRMNQITWGGKGDYLTLQRNWRDQIDKFIELDKTEWISKMDFVPRTIDIRKSQGKTVDGTNPSFYHLSLTDSRFKFFDLKSLPQIKNYLVKIDSTWNTLGENLVEFKYNSTNILKRNIKIIKQNNKNCYEDRALLGFGTSIIHIKKYYVNLIKHIKETDDFFYEKLSKKFIIKGD